MPVPLFHSTSAPSRKQKEVSKKSHGEPFNTGPSKNYQARVTELKRLRKQLYSGVREPCLRVNFPPSPSFLILGWMGSPYEISSKFRSLHTSSASTSPKSSCAIWQDTATCFLFRLPGACTRSSLGSGWGIVSGINWDGVFTAPCMRPSASIGSEFSVLAWCLQVRKRTKRTYFPKTQAAIIYLPVSNVLDSKKFQFPFVSFPWDRFSSCWDQSENIGQKYLLLICGIDPWKVGWMECWINTVWRRTRPRSVGSKKATSSSCGACKCSQSASYVRTCSRG